MSRIERLVNLIAALIDTERPLTRAELHRRVPGYANDDATYRRAFERDKDTLRNMGLPLITQHISSGQDEPAEGYRIPRDRYQLPDPHLTPEEMQALAVAASAVKLKSQASAAALWKLGGDPGVPVAQDVELADDDYLATVFSARSDRRSISFTYKAKRRTVHPYRLSFRNGHWYVNGYDREYSSVRTYRLDRLEGQLETSEPNAFTAPTPTRQRWLPPWQMGEEATTRALVLFDAAQGDLALDQSHGATVEERRGDGSVVLGFEVTNVAAFRSFVLGFLDHAEILAPSAFRDDMRLHLEALVNS